MTRLHFFLAAVPFILLLLVPLVLKFGAQHRYLPVERAAIAYDTSDVTESSISWLKREVAIADDLSGPFGGWQTGKVTVTSDYKDDSIHLSLILIDEDEKMAILNNTIVREGGSYAGMTLTAVEKGRVALTRNGVTQWVLLQK